MGDYCLWGFLTHRPHHVAHVAKPALGQRAQLAQRLCPQLFARLGPGRLSSLNVEAVVDDGERGRVLELVHVARPKVADINLARSERRRVVNLARVCRRGWGLLVKRWHNQLVCMRPRRRRAAREERVLPEACTHVRVGPPDQHLALLPHSSSGGPPVHRRMKNAVS